MLDAFLNFINEIFSVSDTKGIIALIAISLMFFSLICIIFIYYFNKYYTSKHKKDFLYLFWGYEDNENKISADEKLSLFIYYFIGAYSTNSYKWFNKRYKFFPEDIKDIPQHSLMPNATKGNLEKFENKHMKWLRFNVITQNILYVFAIVIICLFFWSEYTIK